MNEAKYFQSEPKFLLNTCNEGDGLAMLRDLKEEVAQLVIFDPQYKAIQKSTTNHHTTYFGSFPPHLNQSETEIKAFFQEIARILKPNGYLIFWIDRDILLKANYHSYLTSNWKVKELLIWIKGHYLSLGSLTCPFRNQAEYCLLIQKKPYLDKIKGSRNIGNTFNEIVNFTKRHNTHTKPYQMTHTIIQQLTQEGDLVVDPCVGSFVSLKACRVLNRNFLGTDITLRELMKFNIKKERRREWLKLEKKN